MHIFTIGNLQHDPERRTAGSGAEYTTFTLRDRMACRNKDDKENLLYVNVSAFGKLGDFAAKYLRKGTAVLITSKKPSARGYIGKDGAPKANINILADSIDFLPATYTDETNAQGNDFVQQTMDVLGAENIPFY